MPKKLPRIIKKFCLGAETWGLSRKGEARQVGEQQTRQNKKKPEKDIKNGNPDQRWFFPLGRGKQTHETPVFTPRKRLFWFFKTPAELSTKDAKEEDFLSDDKEMLF